MALTEKGFVRASTGIVAGGLHVALFTSATTEVSASWYSRQLVAQSGWTVSANGTISNAAAVDFGNATTAGVDITHGALYSAATGGDRIDITPVTVDVAPTVVGTPVSIQAGGYTITPA